jgi:hypothetical protein
MFITVRGIDLILSVIVTSEISEVFSDVWFCPMISV